MMKNNKKCPYKVIKEATFGQLKVLDFFFYKDAVFFKLDENHSLLFDPYISSFKSAGIVFFIFKATEVHLIK